MNEKKIQGKSTRRKREMEDKGKNLERFCLFEKEKIRNRKEIQKKKKKRSKRKKKIKREIRKRRKTIKILTRKQKE